MHDLKELFSFSRAELIALAALLLLALTGGGLLLFERMQEQIPAEIVFKPIKISHASAVTSANANESGGQSPAAGADSTATATPPATRLGVDFKININTAPAESLIMLPHVGQVISERIIARRESHGRFESPGELISVRGIGPRYLQELLPYLTID